VNESGTPLIAREGRWEVGAPLTMDSAAAMMEASEQMPLPTEGIVDMTRVEAVDSAGVAIMLAWKRRAVAEGRTLAFANVPAALSSLAELYGVEDLLTH